MDRFFPVTWSKRTSFTTFDSRLPAKKDILDSSMEAPKKDVKRHQTPKQNLTQSNFATQIQTWNLSKILHRRIFRLKILHRQFHLISTVLVRKNTKNEWKWRNLHRWQKIYTAVGSDGMDELHLWSQSYMWEVFFQADGKGSGSCGWAGECEWKNL